MTEETYSAKIHDALRVLQKDHEQWVIGRLFPRFTEKNFPLKEQPSVIVLLGVPTLAPLQERCIGYLVGHAEGLVQFCPIHAGAGYPSALVVRVGEDHFKLATRPGYEQQAYHIHGHHPEIVPAGLVECHKYFSSSHDGHYEVVFGITRERWTLTMKPWLNEFLPPSLVYDG